MSTILCCAQAFGYGPAGKLSTILERLRNDYSPCFIGTGTALELISRERFVDRVVSCQVEDMEELTRQRWVYDDVDLVLSVGNWQTLAYGQQLNKPAIYVDTLFWMWPQVVPQLETVETYFIQNFIGVSAKLGQLGGTLHHPRVVGPIVDQVKLGRRVDNGSNMLLIHLGGLESGMIQVGQNTVYPQLIMTMLSQVLAEHHYDEVILAGANCLSPICCHLLTIPRSHFLSVGHQVFVDLMHRARLLMTSPGLTTTYEAFSMGVPVLYLPPQNASQWMILHRLRKTGVGDWSVHWSDFYSDFPVSDQLPQEQNVAMILRAIGQMAADPTKLDDLNNRYRSLLTKAQDINAVRQQVQRQDRLMKQLGDVGLETVVQHLHNILSG